MGQLLSRLQRLNMSVPSSSTSAEFPTSDEIDQLEERISRLNMSAASSSTSASPGFLVSLSDQDWREYKENGKRAIEKVFDFENGVSTEPRSEWEIKYVNILRGGTK